MAIDFRIAPNVAIVVIKPRQYITSAVAMDQSTIHPTIASTTATSLRLIAAAAFVLTLAVAAQHPFVVALAACLVAVVLVLPPFGLVAILRPFYSVVSIFVLNLCVFNIIIFKKSYNLHLHTISLQHLINFIQNQKTF